MKIVQDFTGLSGQEEVDQDREEELAYKEMISRTEKVLRDEYIKYPKGVGFTPVMKALAKAVVDNLNYIDPQE